MTANQAREMIHASRQRDRDPNGHPTRELAQMRTLCETLCDALDEAENAERLARDEAFGLRARLQREVGL